jgi:hypothetical protein
MTTFDGNALHVTDRDVDTLTWGFLTSSFIAVTHIRVLARQHAQPVAVKCARVYQPPLRLR